MTQKEMIHIVQSQLAIDLNCTIDDLNREKDSVIFVDAKENPGRRPFPRKRRCKEKIGILYFLYHLLEDYTCTFSLI